MSESMRPTPTKNALEQTGASPCCFEVRGESEAAGSSRRLLRLGSFGGGGAAMVKATVAILLASVLCAIGVTLEPKGSPPPAKSEVNFRNPPREYEFTRAGDWSVMVEKQLRTDAPEVYEKAIARLKEKLGAAMAVLPKSSHRTLEKVQLILMYGPKANGGGRDGGLGYVRKNPPEIDEFDPRWKSGIIVYCAEYYTQVSDFSALNLLVHELSHAYHLEQWADDQEDILRAWKNAMKHGLYRGVKDEKGKTVAKAWAAINQLEYFAELSCMYFVGCNYHPFDRKGLKAYDPVGYAMIEKVWDVAPKK